ncbi:hypothetical protein [Rubrivivax gelatinosus]|uniref:hypothetical protein n=1 Tax=Rubrivivax gelatinosus TaxID=28068 RepID=UPI0012FE40CA|nr:hypothetical protein [Rubrivivax gelatinosus]MBG6079883.1 hypothetical protein [Rubrivivax gelatinosus]
MPSGRHEHTHSPDPRPDPAADPGGQPSPKDADDGVLESLGKAVSRPVTDAAAAEDPALPQPGAPER